MKKLLIGLIAMGILILVLLVLSNWEPPKRDILDGTIWKVVSLNNTPLVKSTTLSIRFHNWNVSGSSGCNTFTGRYEITEESISITDIEMNTTNCLFPGTMEEERTFIKYLQEVTNFIFSEQELTLTTKNGNTVKFISLTAK